MNFSKTTLLPGVSSDKAKYFQNRSKLKIPGLKCLPELKFGVGSNTFNNTFYNSTQACAEQSANQISSLVCLYIFIIFRAGFERD
jgi:hypothetical protein